MSFPTTLKNDAAKEHRRGRIAHAPADGGRMLGLISKLAEILSSYWERFLDGKRLGQDAEVARHLVHLVVALQELCLRGDQLLVLAERLLDGDKSAETSARFEGVLSEQAQAVNDVREAIGESKELLATVDARFYLDLAPLVDAKSGLLTRWERQAELSRFSTTTLFFLPGDGLVRLIEAGRTIANSDGLDVERGTYVVATADSIRELRTREIRDIRRATADTKEQVRAEITSARTDLECAKDYCSKLLGATEAAIGSDAMARLRRELVPVRPDYRGRFRSASDSSGSLG
jgi:hypothetical protein